jgi:hypothetical protein
MPSPGRPTARLHACGLLAALVAVAPFWASPALAQAPAPVPPGSAAGVVTTLEGNATLTRVGLPEPRALKFRDDVFLRDRIVTAERSIARILLGGKAVVTVRERSALTITELPGRSVIDLESGKIGLAVARERMRPGETIDVRTANAVAGVRGTVLVAEVDRSTAQAGGGAPTLTTRVWVIADPTGRGVAMTQLNPATQQPVGPTLDLKAFQAFFATGGVLGRVTQFDARQLGQITAGLKPGHQFVQAANQDQLAQDGVQTATALLQTVSAIVGSGGSIPTELTPTVTTTCVGSNCQAPITAIDNPTQPELTPSTPPPPPPPSGGVTGDGIRTSRGPITPPAWVAPVNAASAALRCDDCVQGGVALGFTFPYRGSSFNAVEVSSNGFLTLGASNGSRCCTGEPNLFRTGSPSLAPLWFDVDPRVGNGVRIDTVPNAAIVTWDAVGEFGIATQGIYTYQVKLTSAGQIIFSYESITETTSSHLALAGISPGGNVADPGNTPFTKGLAFSTGPNGIAYQAFGGDDASLLDLAGKSIFFTPDVEVLGAFDVFVDAIGSFFRVDGGRRLALDRTTPLLSLRDTGVRATGFYVEVAEGAELRLRGPLLTAVDSPLTFGRGLLGVDADSQLVVLGSREPLVSITGGDHAVATDAGAAMFDLKGQGGRTVASDQPLVHGGPLLETAGATVSGQKVLKVDAALLEATAPLINLTARSRMRTEADAIDLSYRAKVAGLGTSLVRLDRSTLVVNHGALVRVDGASVLEALNLVELRNGSFLSLRDGALLSVGGGSAVNLSNALVAFGGAGGNRVDVRNSLCPCTLIGGVPVALTGGAVASNVSIANAVQNPGLGRINLQNPSLGAGGTALVVVNGAASRVTVGR